LPRDLLEGLDQYSHCWVLYEFHANTNAMDSSATRASSPNAVKGKVRVPRLDGEPMGALATRTPHRPTPIGLSIGTIVDVDVVNGAVTLAGCDLVDGTPVLDIKPYVPFCDRVERATAPDWVRRGVADDAASTRLEPLAVAEVRAGEGAEAAVAAAYLVSVKARRARRLRSGGNGVAAAMTRVPSAPKPPKPPSDATGRLSSPEDGKKRKSEAKARRRAGLGFPDALYESGETFVAFVKETLALDMRTFRERLAEGDAKKFETYRVVLCDVEVEYAIAEVEVDSSLEPRAETRRKIVTMLGGVAVPPLDEPGVTKKHPR
jgi:tRNA (Thr-GGU) A37 N-methylase